MKRARYETYNNKYLENVIETKLQEPEEYEVRLKQDYQNKILDILMYTVCNEKHYKFYKLRKKGLTYLEISKIMNCHEETVRVYLEKRANEKILKKINKMNEASNEIEELLNKKNTDKIIFELCEVEDNE